MDDLIPMLESQQGQGDMSFDREETPSGLRLVERQLGIRQCRVVTIYTRFSKRIPLGITRALLL